MRHHLAHQLHDFEFELRFDGWMMIHERDPLLHRHTRGAHTCDRVYRIGNRRLEAPCRITRVDLRFGGKAQDHLAAFGVGDDALQDAVEYEILLHRTVALILEGRTFM
jgi:hypothetical protein